MTAYWMSKVQITDEAAYGEYAKLAGPALELHGGRILARGGKCVTLEGDEYPRNVLVEFASVEQAVACYHSKEYQEAWEFQKNAANREVCIVEGV
ncbi:MAG: DUF1330 domain-containing protein [Rhodospirillaceae bacterium]|nr:DUF1330 domain-containing protein [Rhodospirillaceae bacterium]MBT5459667.1 DUF1330 domain-containing protein [Rhodospirillaceae bacterium]